MWISSFYKEDLISIRLEEAVPKKVLTFMVSLAFLFSVAIAPVWAGGGKNQGDVGIGDVDQGETGADVGNAEGSDAMGNQV